MKLCIVLAFLVLLSVSSYDAKPANLGPVCSNPVNCFVDPCQVSQCDAYPNAECVSNYCGGCNALWYSNNQLIEDCSAPITTQAIQTEQTNCQTVYCFVDPCAFTKCQNYPEAICRSNYCGGCNAWFYLAGERVLCN